MTALLIIVKVAGGDEMDDAKKSFMYAAIKLIMKEYLCDIRENVNDSETVN